jgi:hypothetical protein
VHCSGEVNLVLIVHCNADEKLGFAECVAVVLSKLVSPLDKFIWIASNGSISHMREFNVISPREEAVKNSRNLALQDQLSIDKLDFLLRHLRLTSASSVLLPIWSRAIMLYLLVVHVIREG